MGGGQTFKTPKPPGPLRRRKMLSKEKGRKKHEPIRF